MCQEHERQGTSAGTHVFPHCGNDGDGQRQESGAVEAAEPGAIGPVANDQRGDCRSVLSELGAM